jgi:hypothetical protein
MSALLLVTALLEASIGLALLGAPSLLVSVLLGTVLDTSTGMVVARVAGTALLSLGLICWTARNDPKSHAARGLVQALLLYNAVAVAVFLHAHFVLGLSGIGLWPAVIVHIAMTGWCTVRMRENQS